MIGEGDATGAAHAIAAAGANPCVNQAGADYLTNLQAPAADARCAG